eukprot:m.43336 g.43336  ORF g.43336 m.43336 type:complete len:219 (+) comp11633_c0_seq1:375-1031(+)
MAEHDGRNEQMLDPPSDSDEETPEADEGGGKGDEVAPDVDDGDGGAAEGDDDDPTDEPVEAVTAPSVGDHIVSYHEPTTAFYMSTVVAVDYETYEYTVDWDDGDPTGRKISHDNVALDVAPKRGQVRPGTRVIFPQGHYVGTEGVNGGGTRYHEGLVTQVDNTKPGEPRCSGHHLFTPEQGKRVFRGYDREFSAMPISLLRLCPEAEQVKMALMPPPK